MLISYLYPCTAVRKLCACRRYRIHNTLHMHIYIQLFLSRKFTAAVWSVCSKSNNLSTRASCRNATTTDRSSFIQMKKHSQRSYRWKLFTMHVPTYVCIHKYAVSFMSVLPQSVAICYVLRRNLTFIFSICILRLFPFAIRLLCLLVKFIWKPPCRIPPIRIKEQKLKTLRAPYCPAKAFILNIRIA